eukprot:CAMPEP_0169306884 /NCGR_PEP_ID=MMETSP1017-20121227/991_1 /TAXON_ID=342587 /ORGANISM="Karlodinium micrum, Strain CCMP2283" /LENGTH=553 /DNA_ID=CAMNT_0009400123 /DNA_START=75 /DNA_END=1736 /DNA_ORIENTATION=-
MQMLRSLLAEHLGKRSVGDIVSIMADPSTPFRLRAAHARRYDEMLEAFDPVGREEALVCGVSAEPSVAEPGFLPCAAVAAMYARAAYGALMRQGGGDRVSAFVRGAARVAVGKWNASHNLQAFMELVDIRPEDVLLSSWGEQTFEPAFVVFFDHKLKWLVITIRGTCEWKALYTDMAADTCTVASGLAHEGVARAARFIMAQIEHILAAALHTYPTYKVVCTGHSLGAAVAAVLALLLRESEEGVDSVSKVLGCNEHIVDSKDSKENSMQASAPMNATSLDDQVPVCGEKGPSCATTRCPKSLREGDLSACPISEDITTCVEVSREGDLPPCNIVKHVGRGALRNAVAYCFGAPPVMSPLLAQKCAHFIVSFARNNDYITRLSVLSVDRLVLELTESSAPRMFKDWFLSKVKSPEQLQSLANPRTRAFGNNDRIPELLIPPGTLVHIDSRPQSAQLFWAMPGLYNEMFICFGMFADHLPIRYVENLLQIIRENCQWHAPKLALAGHSHEAGIEHDVLNALRTLINEQTLSPDSVARLIAGDDIQSQFLREGAN